MIYAHSNDTLTLTLDERHMDRLDVCIPVQISIDRASSAPALIVNASAVGCRLETEASLPIGKWVGLTVPGSLPFNGWVAWANGNAYGIDFQFSREETVADAFKLVTVQLPA